MAKYIVPQVLINQLISEVQNNTVRNQNVLVVGPSYNLFRFNETDEKAKTYIGEYSGGSVDADVTYMANATYVTDAAFSGIPVIPYPGIAYGTVPDASYTKVFADDVVVNLVELTGYNVYQDTSENPIVALWFEYDLTGEHAGYLSGSTDSTDTPVVEMERGVNVGDVIRIGGNYQGTVIDIFENEPGSGHFNCVRLSESFPEGMAETGNASLCAKFSNVEISQKNTNPGDWNWTTYAEESDEGDVYGVQFTNSVKAVYTNWGGPAEYEIVSARFYVQHRDLIVSAGKDISSISSNDLVPTQIGTVSPDNPLAFGVHMATLNCGNRLVYYIGVEKDNLAGYSKALDKASLSNDVYIICPTTMDKEVVQATKAHCETLSTAENKLWRIGFVSVKPPVLDVIYDKTAKPSGVDFYAMAYNGSKRLIQFMESASASDTAVDTTVKCLSDVEDGDYVRFYTDDTSDYWDDTPHYTEVRVRKVVSNTVLQLSEDIPDIGANHVVVEVVRKLTPTQQAKYIAEQSEQLGTRRIYNVFPSIASNAGVTFDGSFLACAAAGLVSSVLPQQPVTNVELNGVDDVPVVYQTYSRTQLNEIAAGGTFIIMQDLPGSKVYVRHQISTAYAQNNLLKAELSITKNLDSISYYFADIFSPYIGKYNITPDLIDILSNVLQTGLTYLETTTSAGLYGPQVIEEGTEILYVRQSDVNRDHVESRVRLNLPVPFNYFDLDLEI